jgi:hypothetical protein
MAWPSLASDTPHAQGSCLGHPAMGTWLTASFRDRFQVFRGRPDKMSHVSRDTRGGMPRAVRRAMLSTLPMSSTTKVPADSGVFREAIPWRWRGKTPDARRPARWSIFADQTHPRPRGQHAALECVRGSRSGIGSLLGLAEQRVVGQRSPREALSDQRGRDVHRPRPPRRCTSVAEATRSASSTRRSHACAPRV